MVLKYNISQTDPIHDGEPMNTMTTAIPQFDGIEVGKWKNLMISHFWKMKRLDLLQTRRTTIQPQMKTTRDAEVITDTAEKTITRSQTKTAVEIAADF